MSKTKKVLKKQNNNCGKTKIKKTKPKKQPAPARDNCACGCQEAESSRRRKKPISWLINKLFNFDPHKDFGILDELIGGILVLAIITWGITAILGAGAKTWTETSDADFNAGALDNVEIAGSGTEASLKLTAGTVGWSKKASPVTDTITNIQMLSGQAGWAVGENGTIIRTTDGNSWTKINSDTAEYLWGIYLSSGSNGWAVGDAGTLLKWNGANWSSVTIATENNLMAVHKDWLVSDMGEIYQLSGDNWSSVVSPSSTVLYDVWTVSGTNAWIVGNEGTILKWDGDAWTKVASPTTKALFSIHLLNTSHGWAVGQGGTILFWNGSNWTVKTSPTIADLLRVRAASASAAWAVGDDGTILFWNGSLWQKQTSPVGKGLLSLSLVSDSNGWAAGTEGNLLKYTSGYTSSGAFVSVAKNADKPVTWDQIKWTGDVGSGTSIKFQLATNNDNKIWNFVGPDGKTGSYYTTSSGQNIWSGHQGTQYAKYKVYLATTNTAITPILDDIIITYSEAEPLPAAPVLKSPANDSKLNNDKPTLEWNNVTGAAGYHLQIDNSGTGFPSPEINLNDLTKTTFTPTAELADGNYHWRTKAKNSQGIWGEWSNAGSFTIETKPPLKTCVEQAGYACAAEETCARAFIAASDSARCCPEKCAAKPLPEKPEEPPTPTPETPAPEQPTPPAPETPPVVAPPSETPTGSETSTAPTPPAAAPTTETPAPTHQVVLTPPSLTQEVILTKEKIILEGTTYPKALVSLTIKAISEHIATDENGRWRIEINKSLLEPGTYNVYALVTKEWERSEQIRVASFMIEEPPLPPPAPAGAPVTEKAKVAVQRAVIVTQRAVAKAAKKTVETTVVVAEKTEEVTKAVEPEAKITLTAALPAMAATNPVVLPSIPNIPILIYHAFSWLLTILGLKKHRKPWGIVYNSISKEPLGLAIVRLFDGTNKKLLETQVTDKEGRFGFLTKPGKYFLEITRATFRFPSLLVRGTTDGEFTDLYHGDNINVSQAEEAVNVNAPLDPNNPKEKSGRGALNFWRKIQNISNKMALPLFVIGVLISLLIYTFIPSNTNLIIFLFYLAIAAFELIVRPSPRRPWGTVFESAMLEPVPLAVIGIIDTKYNKLLKSRLTDYEGRFHFLAPAGEYKLTVKKEGFGFPSKEKTPGRKFKNLYYGNPIVIKKEGGIIDTDVPVDKK